MSAAGPLGSEQTDRGRIYRNPETGEKYPSVTTVNGMLVQDWKPGWYAKLVGDRAVDNMPELYRRLRLEGREQARRWVSSASRDMSAAIKGSDIHDLADRMVKSEEINYGLLEPATKSTLAHYLRFLGEEVSWIVFSEFSIANGSIGYAGAGDLLAIIPRVSDLPVVVDIKTSKPGTEPKHDWARQLAAYSRGEVTFAKESSGNYVLADMPEVDQDRAALVHVTPEGYDLHVATGLSGHFEEFRVLHRVWELMSGEGKACPSFELVSSGTGSMELVLLRAVAAARSLPELRLLWQDHRDVWSDELTLASQSRRRELDTTVAE